MSLTVRSQDSAVTAALERLAAARAAGRAGAPVRTLLPAGDIGAAYAVQSAWMAGQVVAGDSVAGRKIGLTSPAVQAQLGVDHPARCPDPTPASLLAARQALVSVDRRSGISAPR
jgi:2-keto-4-pentenoate hydratase